MNKKILLLNDTLEWYHWGCTGSSVALREKIIDMGYELSQIPSNVIHEMNTYPKHTEDFDDPMFYQKFCTKNPQILSMMISNDIIIINGEGALNGMSTIAAKLLYLAYAAKKYLHKNVQIINHSCYPNDAAMIYKGIYAKMDFVAIRENISYNIMTELGIKSVLSFNCLPLYITKHYTEKPERKDKTVFIAGSAACDEHKISEFAMYIKYMQRQGYTVKVLIGAKAFTAADDLEFVQGIRTAMNDHIEIINATTMDYWLNAIASATLLVSWRFHHSIAALTLKTPCLIIGGDTTKNTDASEMSGFPSPISSASDSLYPDLIERTKEVLEYSCEYTELIDEFCVRAERNFEGLTRP